jgi:hypothetical protein
MDYRNLSVQYSQLIAFKRPCIFTLSSSMFILPCALILQSAFFPQAFHSKSHKADDYVRMIQARLDQVPLPILACPIDALYVLYVLLAKKQYGYKQ